MTEHAMIIDLVPEPDTGAPCKGCIFLTTTGHCCASEKVPSSCNGFIWVVVGPLPERAIGREQSEADVAEDYLLQ